MKTLSVLLLLSLLACSKGGGGPKGSTASAENPIEERQEQQPTPVIVTPVDTTFQFMGPVEPMNMTVAGRVSGSVTVIQDGDKIIADVRFSGGPASIVHAQNIYEGTQCPDATHDVNADGFIDEREMSAVTGKIIVPLDGDLTSQDSGAGLFPVADQYGNYTYTSMASYQRFMQDLAAMDVYPEDQFVKLTGATSLDLTGRVIIFQGVAPTVELPDTVLSATRLSKHGTLPIACGIVGKIIQTPGTIDTDETTLEVPVEGSSVGGSSGADDGTDLIVSGLGSGNTSGGVSSGGVSNEVPDETLGGATGRTNR